MGLHLTCLGISLWEIEELGFEWDWGLIDEKLLDWCRDCK
jgi:hypothetical protein